MIYYNRVNEIGLDYQVNNSIKMDTSWNAIHLANKSIMRNIKMISVNKFMSWHKLTDIIF